MIDFKKFKKIEANDKYTVLAHENGHQIKISHKGLSDSHRAELEKMPIHQAKGGFAKYAQKYDPTFQKKIAGKGVGPEAAGTSKFTEPQDIGTPQSLPKLQQAKTKRGERHEYAQKIDAGQPQKPMYPPCVNPSCKSYGYSHPNCRCYGGNEATWENFAEGGKVDHFCSQDRPHKPECEYYAHGENTGKDSSLEVALEAGPNEVTPEVPQPEATPAPAENLDTMSVTEPPAAAAPAAQEVQPDDMPEATPAPEEAPATPSAPASPQEHAQQQAQGLLSEDHAIQDDINSGHIKPETYHDLFGKKDTVGKIGTLFGLLVGGMGAGLSRQPNMLMQMMNNEIQNDLKAQESSAANRQNLLRINQDAILKTAQSDLTETEAKQKAFALTNMQENRLLLDHLVQNRAKIPDGSPQAQAYDQALTILKPMVDNENSSIASKYGLASAMQRFGMPGGGGRGSNTMAMKAGLLGPEFKEMGEDIEQKSIKGIPSVAGQVAARPIPEGIQQQLQAMEVLDQKGKDLLSFIKQNTNTWNPQKRARAKQKVEEMKNFYNNSINGGALTNGRLGWYDEQFSKHPTDVLSQMLGSTAKLKETIDSNDLRRNLLLNNYGLTPRLKAKSGKMMEFKGGKWTYH